MEPLIPGLPVGLADGTFQPVMGTDLRIQVWASSDQLAERAQRAALAEVHRLSDVFTTWDERSELCRWRRGELDDPGPEVATVLALAQHWFELGGGSFHPCCEALRECWLQAQREGVVPTREELADLAAGIGQLPWRVVDGRVERLGDCRGADVNALVKGWIVDRGLELAAAMDGVVRVAMNAGGDLRHWGRPDAGGDWGVGIEDPFDPSDNGAHRLTRARIANRAIATSGLARRGFSIDGQWFGHVLDPRTGWPVDHVAQITVIAPGAATADVLATVAGVLPLDEALPLVDGLADCEALWVTRDREVVRSKGFGAFEVASVRR